MDRKQEIDNRIEELTAELENVQGTKTEIYTRIVGYYRSLKNWNRGKREEYDHRVTFDPGGSPTVVRQVVMPEPQGYVESAIEAATNPAPSVGPESVLVDQAQETDSAEAMIESYLYFFRETCPNCPPVKSYVEGLGMDGRMVNVDTGEGRAAAVENQILSTPTVLLKNHNGETVAQAGSVEQLRTILESAG